MPFNILVALCLCAWLSLSCQSAAWKSFDHVHIGQDKATVVENVGSPTKVRRSQSKDRWIYEFSDHPDGKLSREVQFEEGRVIYVGPIMQSKISATEQDRLNEVSNQIESQRLNAVRDRRDKQLGVTRNQHDENDTALTDAAEQKLRESIYGIEPDPEIEKRKRVPVYTPVD